MCGICGIVNRQGGPAPAENDLRGMTETLRHRGPDQSGVWVDGQAGLGHARLSIIDLSDGRQPLSNEDGTVWITYNGEVYNFPELRKELLAKGHVFRTRTDTEVIVHLYEQEGIQGVERLRGMFAFGLWDVRRRTMYLVRDQLGIKPLYYTINQGRLIFGSEIKAILAHGDVPRSVRPEAVSDFLTFLYVPAPKTMFEGIYKLPAGHWLRFDASGPHVQQYWDLRLGEAATGSGSSSRTSEDLERELMDRLAGCVRDQLVSDVPLGAFLSGGVDSSAVVAMMSQAGQDPLVTLSVGFNETKYSELPYARKVAERFHTRHFEEVVTPEAARVVDLLAWHYDEPFADYSSIPTYYVSLAARRHVTVALSGDGGDENFAGYRRYRFDLAEGRVRRMLPGFIRKWLVGPLGRIYPKADWLPRMLRAKVTLRNIASDPAEAYYRSVGNCDDQAKGQWLTGDLLGRLGGYQSSDVIRDYMGRAEGDDLQRLLYTDIKTYLVDDILTKVDRASMAVSLEVRPPLLDHTFVEFAYRIPSALKLAGGEGKAIFKSALRSCLDDQTLYRPKQGFTPPISEWLRGPLREMFCDLALSPRARHAPYLRQEQVHKAWREHQSGLRDHTPALWSVLTFELWAQKFLGGTGQARP